MHSVHRYVSILESPMGFEPIISRLKAVAIPDRLQRQKSFLGFYDSELTSPFLPGLLAFRSGLCLRVFVVKPDQPLGFPVFVLGIFDVISRRRGNREDAQRRGQCNKVSAVHWSDTFSEIFEMPPVLVPWAQAVRRSGRLPDRTLGVHVGSAEPLSCAIKQPFSHSGIHGIWPVA